MVNGAAAVQLASAAAAHASRAGSFPSLPNLADLPDFTHLPALPSLEDMRLIVDWHWIVGCLMAISASFISNFGLNMQRLSHLENRYEDPYTRLREKPVSEYVPMTKRPRWIIGMACLVFGSILDFAALAFAAQSLIATLGSFTLVSNVILAPLILKETMTKADFRGTCLIIVGCGIALAFGQHESEIYTLTGLMGLYRTTHFKVYAACMVVIMLAMYAGIQWIERHYKRKDSHSYTYSHKMMQLHRLLYPGLAGLMGAQSVLFAKCSAELLKTTLADRGVMFAHMGSYVILATMTMTLVMQVQFLNGGLKRFDALVVVPVFETFWILGSVIAGMVFFNELETFSAAQSVMFPLGIVLTITGVYVLSQRGSTPDGTAASDAPGSARSTRTHSANSDHEEGDVEDSAPLLGGVGERGGSGSFSARSRAGSAAADEPMAQPVVGFLADISHNAAMLDEAATKARRPSYSNRQHVPAPRYDLHEWEEEALAASRHAPAYVSAAVPANQPPLSSADLEGGAPRARVPAAGGLQ